MNPSIGFTGTQEGLSPEQSKALRGLLSMISTESNFHHGDCIGADVEAHEIANSLDLYIILHPQNERPEKQAHCLPKRGFVKQARPIMDRNSEIARCDVLLACPKEFGERIRSGTWATVRRARQRDATVFIIWPDGQITLDEGEDK